MPSIQLVAQSTGTDPNASLDVTIQTLFAPTLGPDEDIALARSIMVALNTDRLALPDDTLPNATDDDRRGWWGDLDAQTTWNGWPLGCRLWLMSRDKITDFAAKQGATIEKAKRYIAEAIQPFVDAKICSRFDIQLAVTKNSQITGLITIYRGPRAAIALEYQDLWDGL